jgi:Protein of unknown function (DUF3341)
VNLPLYGVAAEFDSPTALVQAVHRVREAGYTRMDAYTPFPVEGLDEAMAVRTTWLPWIILAGGLLGMAGGYAMQYWCLAIDYPFNVGGRPLHSWPMFIPVTFEMTILGASLAAVLGMLALNGLPMPYHPLFHVPRFALATRDRFFLCVMANDPQFDAAATARFLAELGAREVTEVPQ